VPQGLFPNQFKPNGSRISCLKAFLSETAQGFDLAPSRIGETETHADPSSKHCENATLATSSCLLKGGVHDPRFAGPLYIEDWQLILYNLNPNGCTKTLIRLA